MRSHQGAGLNVAWHDITAMASPSEWMVGDTLVNGHFLLAGRERAAIGRYNKG